jgi:hypothetical protein
MDVIVKLSLVSGTGGDACVIKVNQGCQRDSHRAEDPDLTQDMRPFLTHAAIEPIQPGSVYALGIELLSVAQ